MDEPLWVFLDVLLLTFGLFALIAGAFTAYFGSGKSRTIGGGLAGLGVALWVVVAVLHLRDIGVPNGLELLPVLKDALIVIGAVVVGALAAIGVFLVAIMRS